MNSDKNSIANVDNTLCTIKSEPLNNQLDNERDDSTTDDVKPLIELTTEKDSGNETKESLYPVGSMDTIEVTSTSEKRSDLMDRQEIPQKGDMNLMLAKNKDTVASNNERNISQQIQDTETNVTNDNALTGSVLNIENKETKSEACVASSNEIPINADGETTNLETNIKIGLDENVHSTKHRHVMDESSSCSSSSEASAYSGEDSDMSSEADKGESINERKKKKKLKKLKDFMEKPTDEGEEVLKTRGELFPEELPPLEDLIISVDENTNLQLVGKVSSVVGVLVIVQAERDQDALNMDTVLFFEDRTPLGPIFEVFGPVSSPFYSIRFNSARDIELRKIFAGLNVYYAPDIEEITSYVFVNELRKIKGSDASWENNNEPPDKYLQFSDDEQEKRSKAKMRGKGLPLTEEQIEKKKEKNMKKKMKSAMRRNEQTGETINTTRWPPSPRSSSNFAPVRFGTPPPHRQQHPCKLSITPVTPDPRHAGPRENALPPGGREPHHFFNRPRFGGPPRWVASQMPHHRHQGPYQNYASEQYWQGPHPGYPTPRWGPQMNPRMNQNHPPTPVPRPSVAPPPWMQGYQDLNHWGAYNTSQWQQQGYGDGSLNGHYSWSQNTGTAENVSSFEHQGAAPVTQANIVDTRFVQQ